MGKEILSAFVTAYGKNGTTCQLGAGVKNWRISSEYCHCPFPNYNNCPY